MNKETAENQKMYEDAMMRWQYTLLLCDWKRLTKVIAAIAASLRVAIDTAENQECRKILQDVLDGNLEEIGDITSTYKNLIGGENAFGQYCLGEMRQKNLQLESEMVGLKAHIEALKTELGGKISYILHLKNRLKEKENQDDV